MKKCLEYHKIKTNKLNNALILDFKSEIIRQHRRTHLKAFRSRCRFSSGSTTRTTDAQRSLFSLKYQTFGLGQAIWADKFWGIWGIYGQFISTNFATVSPLSIFPINQPLFLQKNKPLHPNPKYIFGIGI